ncbi:MAG: tetratricopeptide repeat protein, partial [Planctomycetes bacterium]|nr:tetratricopeptide repeat protein [Planctomycetota bacterium]
MARPDTIVSSRSPGPSGRGSGGLQPIGITRTHDLTAASFDRSRSFDGGYRGSYGGPRLGVPGYASSFYRYSPPAYRPGHYYPPYYKYPYYPYYPYYSHHHHGFSFGFGFYSGCYAYPTYPLVYYPSYYAPLYPTYYTPTFFPSYVSSVVVEQPATYAYAAEPSVTYYPSSGYVSSGESTATDAYVGYGSTTAPEVTYDQGYAAEQAQPPPSSTDRDVFVQNNVQVYPAPSAPETTPEPAPAAPATPWGPQQETVTPRQASPSHGHGPKIIEVPSEQPEPAPTPEPSAPSEAPAQPSLPTAELQELMVGGTKSFNEGRYAEAADVFRQVAQADPQNVDAALAHAVARFATGQYALAAESVRNGVKLFPPIVDTTFDLRERYSKVGDFVSQVRQLEQFVEKNPENDDALLVLGFVRH